jgi:hypothetical protein
LRTKATKTFPTSPLKKTEFPKNFEKNEFLEKKEKFPFTAHKNFPLRRTNFLKKLPLRRTNFSLYGAPIFPFTAHKNLRIMAHGFFYNFPLRRTNFCASARRDLLCLYGAQKFTH